MKRKSANTGFWLLLVLAITFLFATFFLGRAAVEDYKRDDAMSAAIVKAVNSGDLCNARWFPNCLQVKSELATKEAYSLSYGDNGSDAVFDTKEGQQSILKDSTDLEEIIKAGSVVQTFSYNGKIIAQQSGDVIVCDTGSHTGLYVLLCIASIMCFVSAIIVFIDKRSCRYGSGFVNVLESFGTVTLDCLSLATTGFVIVVAIIIGISLILVIAGFLWTHLWAAILVAFLAICCLLRRLIRRRRV